MQEFIICVNNREYEASLERWKVYVAIPDDLAKKQNLRRVIDESGEDYLFPSDYFVPLTLPKVVQDAMMRDSF
ncbi:hypothetical protein [Desulfosarcina sp.]|jgi:hypothetical protein|uniref:hypothetical protein n=1 Tax=Desulfosarcina sp. TaxID=2027861 RepID=UPI0029A7D3D6|nr:hypothetical protein [Desulfosarcina sp.]MDX2451703.1 hypothetical protein [Desulfosarcina sp.]MDX2489490.1 hypothetical protein [Desulfosarcina sp.]